MGALLYFFFFFALTSTQDTCLDNEYYNFNQYSCLSCPSTTENSLSEGTPYTCNCPDGTYFSSEEQIGFFFA
jgi:hypothetical protein